MEETADYFLTMWSEDHRAGIPPGQRKGEVQVQLDKSRRGNQGRKIQMLYAPTLQALVGVTEKPEYLARARRDMLLNAAGMSTQHDFATILKEHINSELEPF